MTVSRYVCKWGFWGTEDMKNVMEIDDSFKVSKV